MNETNERQNGPDGHCAPAGDEREDAVEGIKHIREPLREFMADIAAARWRFAGRRGKDGKHERETTTPAR